MTDFETHPIGTGDELKRLRADYRLALEEWAREAETTAEQIKPKNIPEDAR